MALAILCDCKARFVSDLVGNPEDGFSKGQLAVKTNRSVAR